MSPSSTKTAEPQRIPLEPWEVGGELLDILSRGLYSDAKDSIREYVQNGIDAGAKIITITSDGPVVSVRDNGDGMNFETLRKARRFGLSEKTPQATVGYRGIGLYSAFGMCESLAIVTRKARMKELLTLTFHFGPMRRILEQDKAASKRAGISLADLLHEYTEFQTEQYTGAKDDHFTVVRLEGITPEYRPQVSDPQALENYLLNTVPVAYPRQGYGPTVNVWLRKHVKLNPVRIAIRVGDDPETRVQPLLASAVEAPECSWLKNADGAPIAFIWHALSTTKAQIGDAAAPVSGFLLKMKGFTLGNRATLKQHWPPKGGRTLYHHFTGEIHILQAAGVYPNASRDDLEPGPQKQVFIRYLQDYFSLLNAIADRARQIISIKDRLTGLDETLASLRDHVRNPQFDQFELYRQSKNLAGEFEKAERDLVKIRNLKKPGALSEEQGALLKALATKVKARRREADALVTTSSKETARAAKQSQVAQGRPPPQSVLLGRAYDAVSQMSKTSRSRGISKALKELETAKRLLLIPRAISVLDELSASGVPLTARAESCRKELRTMMGWSPTAPLTLEAALLDEGVVLQGAREEILVACIDQGILGGLGGRGEAYESILQAIAALAAEEDELS